MEPFSRRQETHHPWLELALGLYCHLRCHLPRMATVDNTSEAAESTTTTTAAPSATAPGDRTGVFKSTNHAAATEGDVRGERIFHYLFTVAAFTGLIAYFTMASDLGNTPVRQYMNQGLWRGPWC